jgi:glycosyltransferase involved in cell wall biosynthesis
MKILHVISGLIVGGAERMMVNLLGASEQMRRDACVVCLGERGPIAELIEELDVELITLDIPRGKFSYSKLRELDRIIKDKNPDLVQTWMYHADLLGGWRTRSVPCVWNIQHSNLDKDKTKLKTRIVMKLCAWLSSSYPAKIICCSEATKRVHADYGYDVEKMVVVPNGVDTRIFVPDADARLRLCELFALRAESPIIGMIARWTPEKDFRTFLDAAVLLQKDYPDTQYLLVGRGVDTDNNLLCEWVEERGLQDVVTMTGERREMPLIHAGIDVFSLVSNSEGLPLVLGEAMACGTPCVTTDVGDAAAIVGDAGYVIPPQDARALADAWAELLAIDIQGKREWSQRTRRRMEDHYSIEAIASQYYHIYESVLSSD